MSNKIQETDLPPCPVCGRLGKVIYRDGKVAIRCFNCTSRTVFKSSVLDAVHDWSTRNLWNRVTR